MASKHRVTVGEELRYDSDLQALKNLNGTYAAKSVLPLNALDYGAKGDGTTDDTTALQAWINAVISTSGRGYLPARTYKISSALLMGTAASFRWELDGGGATIIQATDNTPIFKFTKEGTSQFALKGFSLSWANNQASANTSAVAILFDSDTNTNAGFYNFEIGNIEFQNGYRGICINEGSANRNPIWGADLHHIRSKLAVTGAVVRLLQATSGQPNLTIRQLYARLDSATEPAVNIQGYHAVHLENIEFNNGTSGTELQVVTCDAVTVDALRSEAGTFSSNFAGLFVFSDARASISGVEVQSKSFTSANWSYIIRGIGVNTHLTIAACSVSNLSVTTGQVALIQGNDMGSFEYAGGFRNGSSITTVYQFDNTPQKQIRYGNDFSNQGVRVRYLSGAGKVTVADSDFPSTPADGTVAVVTNTTDGTVRIAARGGGAWKVAQLT